jgi:hypothetical protein
MKKTIYVLMLLFSISSLTKGENIMLMNFGEASHVDTINHWKFGIQLTQSFNYPLMHTSSTFSIILKKNELFIGPEYTKLQRTYLYGDPVDKWKQDNWGINIGYRYKLNSAKAKTCFFIQTCFSVYQTVFHEYQLGPPFDTEHKKVIIENTAGLGFDYHYTNHIHIFGTIGIGSTNGFFLMINQFIPHSSLGLQYMIR